MLATYVRPLRTTCSRMEAVQAYWLACESLGMKPTIPLVSTLVSHSALECGNFEKAWNWNISNIKAGGAWEGLYTCITLNEVLKVKGEPTLVWFAPEGQLTGDPRKGGKLKAPYLENPLSVPPGHPQTRMRAFESLTQAVENKIRFFLSPNWETCLKPARIGDVSGYVRMIRVRNYFTAYKGQPDPCRYETDVISLANTYRPLVERVAQGERASVSVTKPELVPNPIKFQADDEWRKLAFQAYELAQAMDVHEIVRKEALKELREEDS
jgi:hypothetical protein